MCGWSRVCVYRNLLCMEERSCRELHPWLSRLLGYGSVKLFYSNNFQRSSYLKMVMCIPWNIAVLHIIHTYAHRMQCRRRRGVLTYMQYVFSLNRNAYNLYFCNFVKNWTLRWKKSQKWLWIKCLQPSKIWLRQTAKVECKVFDISEDILICAVSFQAIRVTDNFWGYPYWQR